MTPTQQKLELAYPTYAKFLEDFKPAQLMVTYCDINTISKSVGVITPRLSLEDISIIYSNSKLNAGVDYVKNWLDFLNKFSNLNKQLTETGAVAFMIYQDYKYFFLTDLNLIFGKIMRCEYGIFYGSVDAPRILGAFLNYAQERFAISKDVKAKVCKEVDSYMAPLCKSEFDTIANKLKGTCSSDKAYRDECNRLYKLEAVPRLEKIRDEIEEEIIKKIV